MNGAGGGADLADLEGRVAAAGTATAAPGDSLAPGEGAPPGGPIVPAAPSMAEQMLPRLVGMSFAIIGSAFPFVLERFDQAKQGEVIAKLIPIAVEYEWDFSAINKRMMLWLDLGAVVGGPLMACVGDFKKLAAEKPKKPEQPAAPGAPGAAVEAPPGDDPLRPASNLHMAKAL